MLICATLKKVLKIDVPQWSKPMTLCFQQWSLWWQLVAGSCIFLYIVELRTIEIRNYLGIEKSMLCYSCRQWHMDEMCDYNISRWIKTNLDVGNRQFFSGNVQNLRLYNCNSVDIDHLVTKSLGELGFGSSPGSWRTSRLFESSNSWTHALVGNESTPYEQSRPSLAHQLLNTIHSF